MPRHPLLPYTTLFRSATGPGPARLPPCQPSRASWPSSAVLRWRRTAVSRSEEHTSELQSLRHLVCPGIPFCPTRRSSDLLPDRARRDCHHANHPAHRGHPAPCCGGDGLRFLDRKSTRLNSSHLGISYAQASPSALHDALPICYRTGPGEIATMPTIPRIVAIQRRVAVETDCGFFDTFAAMGGEGTMARWYAAQPRLVSADFIHPYPAGGKLIANVFTREIGAGLDRFKLRTLH